jgi:hypothetical protein
MGRAVMGLVLMARVLMGRIGWESRLSPRQSKSLPPPKDLTVSIYKKVNFCFTWHLLLEYANSRNNTPSDNWHAARVLILLIGILLENLTAVCFVF